MPSPRKSKSAGSKPKSAKGKSAKGKKKGEDAAEENPFPKLEWPWRAEADTWMGKTARQRLESRRTLRQHYVVGDTVLCSAEERRSVISMHVRPFADAMCEAAVQLLVTVLGLEAERKQAPDDFRMLAASLRFHHSESHFKKMVGEMQRYASMLDCGGKPLDIQTVLMCFGGSELSWDGHVVKMRVDEELKGLNVRRESEMIRTRGAIGDFALVDSVELTDTEKVMLPFLKYLHENQLRLVDVFRELDRDQSGSISKAEFARIMKREALPISMDRLETLIDSLDLDGNGSIDYKEFSLARAETMEGERSRLRVLKEAAISNGARALPPSGPASRAVSAPPAGKGDKAKSASGKGKADKTKSDKKGGAEAAPPPPPPPESLFLTMTFDDLAELALHCHYVTRP